MMIKMKVRKWSPEKLKRVEKNLSPQMFGDLWDVIWHAHGYPRAGVEPSVKKKQKKIKKKRV